MWEMKTFNLLKILLVTVVAFSSYSHEILWIQVEHIIDNELLNVIKLSKYTLELRALHFTHHA